METPGEIPRLSRDDIERKTEEVIAWQDETLLESPSLTPVAEIVKRLHDLKKLRLVYGVTLGVNPNGNRILGSFQFDPPTINIDGILPLGSPRFKFALAHELGHFVIHRKLTLSVSDIDKPNVVTDDRHAMHLRKIGRRLLQTPREWLEWQANTFASALLVPRATVRTAIAEKQRALGITRNLGIIYLDSQFENYVNYRKIIDHLQKAYEVSQTLVAIRLNDLGLLQDKRLSNWKRIGSLFLEEDGA